MPINLNALLRYKTIDRCLRNTYRPATIDVLIESCSEALTEKNGTPTGVSERTIRDDLRILRSDILEFNAPIKCENGIYFYEDPDFELFASQIENKELLKEIQKFLITVFDEISHPKAYDILHNLSKITDEELPAHIIPIVEEQEFEYESSLIQKQVAKEKEQEQIVTSPLKVQFQMEYYITRKPLFSWKSILELV